MVVVSLKLKEVVTNCTCCMTCSPKILRSKPTLPLVVRDIETRGRQLENVLQQYTTFVKPAFEEFCLPTKKHADVIIPRGGENTGQVPNSSLKISIQSNLLIPLLLGLVFRTRQDWESHVISLKRHIRDLKMSSGIRGGVANTGNVEIGWFGSTVNVIRSLKFWSSLVLHFERLHLTSLFSGSNTLFLQLLLI